jgi:hypothetical protein
MNNWNDMSNALGNIRTVGPDRQQANRPQQSIRPPPSNVVFTGTPGFSVNPPGYEGIPIERKNAHWAHGPNRAGKRKSRKSRKSRKVKKSRKTKRKSLKKRRKTRSKK